VPCLFGLFSVVALASKRLKARGSLFPKFLRSGLISFFGVAPMPDPHPLDCDTWAYDHFGGPS
jgi:hypothetical protein